MAITKSQERELIPVVEEIAADAVAAFKEAYPGWADEVPRSAPEGVSLYFVKTQLVAWAVRLMPQVSILSVGDHPLRFQFHGQDRHEGFVFLQQEFPKRKKELHFMHYRDRPWRLTLTR